MNAQSPHPKPKSKPDIYLLIKQQNLHKLQQYNSLYEKRKSMNQPNSSIDKNAIGPTQHTSLSKDLIHTDKKGSLCKIVRKDSEVSIVDDFMDTSRQDNIKSTSSNEKQYIINISACPQKDTQKTQIDQKDHQYMSQYQNNQPCEIELEIVQKSQNFKAFFQYILDFKLWKKDSYKQKQSNSPLPKFQEKISSRSKKLSNSLTIFQPDKQAEKNLIKDLDDKKQGHQNKQTRNFELQNSQISFVDVRVSNASIDDFNPMFHQERTRLTSSPTSSIKNQRKVHFDFEKTKQTEPNYNQKYNPMVQSENNVTIINNIQSRIVSLEELKRRIQNFEQYNFVFTHHGYFCDQCKIDPIVGKRYRCIECEEYDLCQNCYKNECDKYGKILNKYECHDCQNQDDQVPKTQTKNYLCEIRPLLKKKMSDILQEQTVSQNLSSEQNIQIQSETQLEKNERQHIHLMQEVQNPRPKHQINFDKILKQTNRCSLRSINDKNTYKESKNSVRKNSPLTPSIQRQKLLNSLRMNRQRLTFSERTIPLKSTELNPRKFLESTKKQVENLRKSSQSILNLFK